MSSLYRPRPTDACRLLLCVLCAWGAGDTALAGDRTRVPVDPTSEAVSEQPEESQEALRPFDRALRRTGVWPMLRTARREPGVAELRLWRSVGMGIYGLALQHAEGRVELRLLRLQFCSPWLAPEETPGDHPQMTFDRCVDDPRRTGVGWHTDDDFVFYKIIEHRRDRHTPALAALWKELQRELGRARTAAADDCAAKQDGEDPVPCTLSTSPVLDALEWADGARYGVLPIDPAFSRDRARHHARMLAAVDRYLGGDSVFQPLE